MERQDYLLSGNFKSVTVILVLLFLGVSAIGALVNGNDLETSVGVAVMISVVFGVIFYPIAYNMS